MTGKPILVLNAGSGSVSFIDPAALAVDGAVEVGEDPRDLVQAGNGWMVFVSVTGDGSVAMLDTGERRVVRRTAVGRGPGHIYLHPSGEEVWVANDGSGDLTVLNAVAGEPLATIPVGAGHHKIAFTPDRRWTFATNIVDATVTAVDAARHLRSPGEGRSDQEDRPGFEGFEEHGAQGGWGRRDLVQLRAQDPADAEAGAVG